MRKFLLYFLLILALLGAVDAGYLLVQTVSGKAVICPNVPIGRFNLNQCNIVLATPYAKFLGLPVALYGFIAYLLFAIIILYELNKPVYYVSYSIYNKQLMVFLSGAGFLISVYFVYLQFFEIKALCLYCLVSTALIILIFIGSVVYNFRYSKGT